MTNSMTDKQVYALAKKRAEAKRSFGIHLIVYICVNITLVLVWAFLTGRGFPWFIFPILGWGIGVVCHYISAYRSQGRQGPSNEAIEREVEQIRRKQQ